MTTPGTDIALRDGNGIQPARPQLALAFQGAADLDSWIGVVENIAAFAEQVCRTSFVPKAYRNDPASTTAAILTGRELGLPPMTALRHVQVVEGMPSLSAEYKRARVLAAGHRLDIPERTTEACTVIGHRKGHEPVTVRYTMADARTAGIVKDRGAWMTRPRRMLFARASTEVVDALFTDLTNGLPTAELLEDDAEAGEMGGYAEQAPPPPRVTAQEIRARAVARTVPSEVVGGDRPAVPLADRSQSGQIWAELTRLGHDKTDAGRPARLALISAIIGREISSSAELTAPEAASVIAELKRRQPPATPARPVRNANPETGEVIPDGDAGPTTSGASSSARAPGSASRTRTGGQSPSSASGSGTTPDDPRAAFLAAFDALLVPGPEIPGYLTRLSGHPYASVDSLSAAAARWFADRLARIGSRDELEAAATAAEARREQDHAAEAGFAPADGEVPGE